MSKSLKNKLKWLASLITSVSLLLPYMLFTYQTGQLDGIGWLFEYIYFALFFTPIFYMLLFLFMAVRLAKYKKNIKWLLVFGLFALGILLAFILPIHIPALKSNVSLIINTTAEKNPNSQGSEIWVIALTQADGKQIPQSEFKFDDQWQIKDGAFMSAGEQASAMLSWGGKTNQPMQLTFLTHNWSGIAQVTWNGSTQRLDLYSQDAQNKIIDLPYVQQVPALYKFIFLFLIGAILGLLLLNLALFFFPQADI